MECITHKAGYKHQLEEPYVVDVAITPEEDVETDYLGLTTDGILTVKKGYAWDGPSGPTVDTLNFMRASLRFATRCTNTHARRPRRPGGATGRRRTACSRGSAGKTG